MRFADAMLLTSKMGKGAISQEMWTPEAGQGKGMGSPLEPPKVMQSSQCLDFCSVKLISGLLISRATLCFNILLYVLSYKACDT